MYQLFMAMFPDSDIAQKFTLGSTKLSFLICFGIGPYVQDKLLKNIREAPVVVLSFDESSNKVSEEEQMDIVIRFVHGNIVTSLYLCSQFRGHTTAVDLKKAFQERTRCLLGLRPKGPYRRCLFPVSVAQTAENMQCSPCTGR